MTIQVSDFASNSEENIVHAAKIVGKSRRLDIFTAIYKGKKAVKTQADISKQIVIAARSEREKLKKILDLAKKLVDNQIVEQVKIDGLVAYKKVSTVKSHYKRIISLARNPKKLKSVATKRYPSFNLGTIKIIKPKASTVKEIHPAEIDDFSTAAKFDSRKLPRLPEKDLKKLFADTIGASTDKDWGGERCDLEGKVKVGGKVRRIAFAFKGPATTGKLTPKKMGKNGDQIARLFGTHADIFIVGYEENIDSSVLEQMKAFATSKSFTSNYVRYGIFDYRDISKLRPF